MVVGQLQANCYLVYEERSKEALVIDPGDDADYIIRRIQDLKISPKLVVATHGHIDHILGVTEIKLTYKVPFYIHKEDIFLLSKAGESARYWLGFWPDPLVKPDNFLKEGKQIFLGKESLTVLETPGHTPGSVCLYNQEVIFSGDTLFANGIGRTDFRYSSEEKLQSSLKKIFHLPLSLKVYPGHGPDTVLEKEKRYLNF